MDKLIREQAKVIKNSRRVKSMEDVADAIENEIEPTAFTNEAYAAGYIRGVAEATNVTIRELLENL